MKKKYLKLTKDQKERGVEFSAQYAMNDSGSNGRIYEVLNDDIDRNYKIDKLMLLEDTFWDYIIIRVADFLR